jgi:hypothetical protein
VRRTVLSSGYVYQLEVNLTETIGDLLLHSNDTKSLIFQFIFQPRFHTIENYLMAFDLDIVQMCFDGHRVYSTWAAIHALTSRTFICYCLSQDIETLGRTAIRVVKYICRGFDFLYPHDFPMDRFLSLPFRSCNITNMIPYSSINYRFGRNHDYFGMQKRCVQFFLDL